MSTYLIPIESALLLFPFLAAVITIPYILKQYHTYGSLLPLRIVIVYSFIFYLLCAYFLVILPLPPVEEVAAYTTPTMQLIPFASLKEFTMSTSLIWNDPSTYWTAFNEPSMYLIVFNILLTVPFGVYLRYYFQCSWKKTLLCTFLLTLSFECLQLSALFGLYPRPYRLFDVDDLITNTLGGLLGYAITPFLVHFLPKREKLDEESYERGRQVSPLRRAMAFFLDVLILILLWLCTTWITYTLCPILSTAHPILVSSGCYAGCVLLLFWLLPLFTKGKTIGKACVRIQLRNDQESAPRWYQYILHALPLYLFLIPAPWGIFYLLFAFLSGEASPVLTLGACLVCILVYAITMKQELDSLLSHKTVWYERPCPLHNASFIQVHTEKDEKMDNSEKPSPLTEQEAMVSPPNADDSQTDI